MKFVFMHRNTNFDTMNKLLTIIGPTASGKTSLAVQLAKQFDGEIISADSRQLYKGMDIGTGKDLSEYDGIPHHMIDICKAGEQYNLFRFINDFHKASKDIKSRKKTPIFCGGTGLYVQAILEGYQLTNIPDNPTLRKNLESLSTGHLRTKANLPAEKSRKRLIRAIEKLEHTKNGGTFIETNYPPKKALVIGLLTDTNERREKISLRLKKRFEEGMLEEVENLLQSGVTHEQLAWYGLEYKFISAHLKGELSYDDMYRKLETGIHQFSKRQMTYFRKMEKDGIKINWLHPEKAYKETLKLYGTR